MRNSLLAAIGILVASNLGSAAQSMRSELEAVETVVKALDRGYGATCSLSGVPVPNGGYYRCLDIGPYRFMSEYNRMRAFVLIDGQPPYPIMTTESGSPEFLVKGPWQADLAQRVRDWWIDEVEGGKSRRDQRELEAKRRGEAERAVRRFSEPDVPVDEPQQEPQQEILLPAPQAPYLPSRPRQHGLGPQQPSPPPASLPAPMTAPRPANPTARIPSQATAPLPSGSIPLRSLPGGPTEVAPGVTAYPPGTIQNPRR